MDNFRCLKQNIISPYVVRPIRRVGAMNVLFAATILYVSLDVNMSKESHKTYATYGLFNRRKVPTKTVFETN